MANAASKKDPQYFMYFPGNYRWSSAFINMLSSAPYGGCEIGELDRIGRRLKGCAPQPRRGLPCKSWTAGWP